MPTTYTHDLFGKMVYRKLPKEVKDIIRENGELYRIGLHGPDILFYYMVSKNPVSLFGIQMHKERAKAFFEQGMEQVRKMHDRELLAYLLGFGCHYLLDSACHPYVNEVADSGEVSHTLLEKEFDRTLMEETGKNPLLYYPSDCIIPRYSNAKVIHRAIPLVRTGNIFISLKMMKILTNAMVYKKDGKMRKFMEKALSFTGKEHEKELLDHFMTKEPSKKCAPHIEKLEELFRQCVEEAPASLMELYSLAKSSRPLSDRWNKTYNG